MKNKEREVLVLIKQKLSYDNDEQAIRVLEQYKYGESEDREVNPYSKEELFKIIQSYEKHCMGMNYVTSKEIIDKDIHEFISTYKK